MLKSADWDVLTCNSGFDDIYAPGLHSTASGMSLSITEYMAHLHEFYARLRMISKFVHDVFDYTEFCCKLCTLA